MTGLPKKTAIFPGVDKVLIKSLLVLFISIASIIVIYNNTVVQMVKLWTSSDTYAHGFIVPFISLWLIWRIFPVWKNIEPQPYFKSLLLFPIFAFLWFAGNLVSVNAVTQLSFVIMIGLCIPAVMGLKISSTIIFPIVFLLFAVPVGDFLLPMMMDWTADFTIIALQTTGIPVYREGLQFVIPSGRWSVVEACSGIRYLLASVTVGSLFAYLNYQNYFKRFAFILLSIIVPLIANWLRAYMIVLIGHYSGNELATGVDHLVYGWLFFGLIIMLMLYIGMKWADPEITMTSSLKIKNTIKNSISFEKSKNFWLIYFFILSIAILPVIFNRIIDSKIRELPVIMNDIVVSDAWKNSNNFLTAWHPSFQNSVYNYNKNYINSDGQEVGLYISYYRQQNYDRKLVTSTNSISNTLDSNFSKILTNKINVNINNNKFSIEKNILKNKDLIQQKETDSILVWKFYWVGGKYTSNNVYAKLLGALSKIKGDGDDGAILVIYTPFSNSSSSLKNANSAENTIDIFLKENLENINKALLSTKNN